MVDKINNQITNKKYVLLNESMKAISGDKINLLILKGSYGCGKTYTTLNYLKENDINYKYINSYATPLSFYQLLYENRNKDVVVFDDLYGANNPLVLAMLKSACWISENNERTISYYSTSGKLDSLELPSSFKFKARIILIFNEIIKDYEPIINRGITINFNLNFKDKLQIFEEIKNEAKIDDDVLQYIKDNCNEATNNLSIRTLVILSNIKRNKQDFKIFAEEILPKDDDKDLLLTMSAIKWSDETGYHRRTYYKQKKKFGLK